MRKEDMNIAIGIAGLAAAILLFGSKKGAADSGYGGYFPIPEVQGAGTPEAAVVSGSPTNSSITNSSITISDKILAAMKGIVQPATAVYGGSSPQSKKEISTIQAAGISTTGLQSSYDPWTNTAYTFAPETATVEKKIISMAGFNTEGLKGSFDPESGKITTFSGAGAVSYSQATTKKAAISVPSTGAYYSSSANRGQSRGGWGV